MNLTGAVLDFLIRNRVETVFITATGRYRARLLVDPHKHVALRRDQYFKLNDDAFCLKTMKILVRAKLENMFRFLMERGNQYKDEKIRYAAAALKAFSEKQDTALSKDAIRGMEGAGTRIYFSVFQWGIRNGCDDNHLMGVKPSATLDDRF